MVLAIGLLGLAALHAISLRSVDSAHQRTQATVLAVDMLERMRANKDRALDGDYDIDDLSEISGLSDSSGGNCGVGDDVKDCDLRTWGWLLLQELQSPQASSIACVAATGVCSVTISLEDTRGELGDERLEGDDDTFFLEFVYETRL